MPAYSIQAIQAEYVAASTRTASFVSTSRGLVTPAGRSIHVRDLEEVAGLGLLKLTLAWESFLEDSFLRYLCGAPSCAGVGPTLLVPKEPTLRTAYSSLLGGQKYLGWQSATTLARANKCFAAGAPYASAIGGATTDLKQISAVRNRIAHRSPFSVTEFQAVVVAELGSVPRGMTPGRFLLGALPNKGGIVA
ncbi:MAG: hypothetical protein QOJ27_2395, partial [Sphingomonadales bacterium]|nr:hypothetical protein [Sphingomonadales bacterium]